MGKQSKRKNKQRRGGGGCHHRPTGLADDPSSSPTSRTSAAANSGGISSSSSSTSNHGPAAKITLKIRHGDPRVRHASLVALSRTLYDAASLERAASKRKVVRREKTTMVGGNHDNNKNAIAGKSSSSLSPPSGAAEACNPMLLRALSERILDVDIPCATIAVGCLSNYISFYYGCGFGDDNDDIYGHGDGKKKKKMKNNRDSNVAVLDEVYDDEDVVVSDVMVPILLQRIQTTSAMLHSMIPNDSTTEDDDAKKDQNNISNNVENSSSIDGTAEKYKLKMQEQWILLSLTLDTTAGLIENCPRAVQRLSSGNNNVLVQLLDVLKLACVPSAREPSMDTANNALRALHSLLDDNLSLIESIIIPTSPTMDQLSTPLPSSPFTLHSMVSQIEFVLSDDVLLPIMARLHACGSLLALRSVYLQQRIAWEEDVGQLQRPPPTSTEQKQHLEAAIERLQTSTEQFVLPCLYSFFGKYATENDMKPPPTTTETTHFLLIQKIMSLSKQLSDMKNDENVELQVVSQVNARAEPARLIARRQKETRMSNVVADGCTTMEEMGGEVREDTNIKDENHSTEQNNGKHEDIDALLVVDENDDCYIANKQQQQKQQAEDDLRDELDKVVSEWKVVVGTQKLALELVANLTSGKEIEDEEDKDEEDDNSDEGMMYANDDDEHMWDSDDEARLLSSAANITHKQARGAVTTNNLSITAYEHAIYNSMMDAQHNLPITLLRYFRYWVGFLRNAATFVTTNPTATNNTDTADADMKEDPKLGVRFPKLISEDVNDILSTCALCLGNVMACNVPEKVAGLKEEENTTNLFLGQLVSLLNSSFSSSTSNTVAGDVGCTTDERGECRHQQHVTSVLLSLLRRNQPQSHLLIDAPTLDYLISILLSKRQRMCDDKTFTSTTYDIYIPDDDDDYHVDATLQTHRNIISMLSVICTKSEIPLPETTDRKICRALLSRLTYAISDCNYAQGSDGENNGQLRFQQEMAIVDSIVIMHEILNVLMDMYSDDDCHERVFDEECVLDHLRKVLPWFKRRIKMMVVAAAASSVSSNSNRAEKLKMDLVKEDECVWNETSLNLTRFLKYKEGRMRR